MKLYILKSIVVLSFITLLLNSCNLKDKFKQETTPNTNLVNASIIGIVKDEMDIAIPNATIISGSATTISDANGVFVFSNIQCSKKSTTIKISKQGYFNGYKSISVQANEKQNVYVSLLKKENPLSLNATNGGMISSGNGIEIAFPANGLINKNTGQAYNGLANIFIKKIDPTTELGKKTMPGNLVGQTTNSEEKLLQSFGMLGVEMEDANGNPLQLATGKEATINYEIPASLVSQSQSSIPLWHFDDTKMVWIEEGSATKQGTKYVGNVKHFSFWNYDQPFAAINLEMTLKDQN